MDYFDKFSRQLFLRIFFAIIFAIACSIGFWWLAENILYLDKKMLFISFGFVALAVSIFITSILGNSVQKPVKKLEESIVFATHDERIGTTPEVKNLRLGKDLVTALSRQIYDATGKYSAQTSNPITTDLISTSQDTPSDNAHEYILESTPVPVVAVDKDMNVVFVNNPAKQYLELERQNISSNSFYDVCHLSFSGDETIDQWLDTARTKSLKSTKIWNRARIEIGDNSKYADIVVFYARATSSNVELIMAFYDQTDNYKRDSQEVSFAAMAVHELRTPLTTMKGYLEILEDEAAPSLTEEYQDFLHKIKVSAGQLTTFVGNILNIARIEENQLSLTLREENWPQILKETLSELELKAKVQNRSIELTIANDIPTAGIDRGTAQEIVNNLVDNAIKYSRDGGKIIIDCHINEEGYIETTVQDFGIGIPEATMQDLFQKFYRSHKSRIQVGGTGLGLYLCKAIVTAHGGNIWVRSKEGEGTIIGFTFLPYAKVKDQGSAGNEAIVRNAHGWIKNHSMIRK